MGSNCFSLLTGFSVVRFQKGVDWLGRVNGLRRAGKFAVVVDE